MVGTDLLKRLHWRYLKPLLSSIRISRFLLVGLCGAVVDNGTLLSFVELWNVAPELAAVVGKEASFVVMYALNDRWTFAREGRGGIRWHLRRFARSNVVRAGGAVIGISVLSVLYRHFGVWYLFANVVGIGVGFAFNYAMESHVTWRITSE